MTTPTIDYYFQLAFSSSSRQKYLNFVMADFKTVFLTPFIIFFFQVLMQIGVSINFGKVRKILAAATLYYHFLFLFLPSGGTTGT